MGADFVFGFVQSMDGERDPRNLLLAFRVAKNIIQRGYELGEGTYTGCGFSAVLDRWLFILPSAFLGSFTEEMFEVTSCYFPIDFTPVSPCLLRSRSDGNRHDSGDNVASSSSSARVISVCMPLKFVYSLEKSSSSRHSFQIRCEILCGASTAIKCWKAVQTTSSFHIYPNQFYTY